MNKFKKLIAVLLSLIMVFSLVSSVCLAADWKNKDTKASLSFAILSDPHYYPESLSGNNCEEYLEFCSYSAKMYAQTDAMVRTALDTMLTRNPELKYILVPGDLTKDGEKLAHEAIAGVFREYEEAYGVEFIVTTGNHDINQSSSSSFESGKEEFTETITADEFREIYADFGYDLAFEEYAGRGDNVKNQLSYAVDLQDGDGNSSYRLIVVDSCIYSFDEPSKETRGEISPETMEWVKELTDEAHEEDKTPLVMLHHSLAPHMQAEISIFQAFVLNDYLDVAETFARWGINYVFTGHLHTNDIACVVNNDGNVLYDIETSSVADYPCTYREVEIKTYTDGENELKADTVDFDAEKEFTFGGVTYGKGTYKYTAFSEFLCDSEFSGELSATSFIMRFIRSGLDGVFDDIREYGSISDYLLSQNIDIEAILSDFLSPYIGDGIKIGNIKIFTTDNLMWFINDLLDQLYELYVEDEEALFSLIKEILDDFTSIVVSDYPCDKFIDSYGFGKENTPGTLGDMILSAIYYWYTGNEDISDDPFMTDAIDNFYNSDIMNTVFDKLVDVLLHTLIEDNILNKLEIRTYKLLSDKEIMNEMGKGVNYLIKNLLKNDLTYMNLINVIFSLEILPYTDIYDILDKELIEKYLTQSQLESIGIVIADLISDLCVDENPVSSGDSGKIYSDENLPVSATRENYRLPTSVTVTLGEDSGTSAYITWYSKTGLRDDIEIYKADSEPVFTGTGTTLAPFDIEKETETVLRSYPGIDLGITGFLNYSFKINKHTVTLTDLEPGETYYFRLGDENYGWWSETGSITTADGSDNLTFLHVADPQSQNERQYARAWKKVLQTATELYDYDFIINTGDIVDHGDNSKQWAWALDTPSQYLMNTFMMPASGNHEGYGTNATANYFTLPGMPEQDTSTGVYYSFDYNNAHFAVLNTEDLDENEALNAEQINWLKSDMTQSDAQWKFVVLHKAVYSQGSHYDDEDVCAIRSQLQSLMPELGIDMVFQGHDHVYMRTGSLVDGRLTGYDRTYLNYGGDIYRTQILPEGTTYVISGTAGVKTYLQNDPTVTDKYFPRGEKILAVDAPMFSSVEIVDGILYFNAYSVTDTGAESVDRFAIQKDITQGTVEEGYTEPEEEVPSIQEQSGIEKIIAFIKKLIKVMMNIIKLVMPDC